MRRDGGTNSRFCLKNRADIFRHGACRGNGSMTSMTSMGFTLIELVVAMAIFAILLSQAMPLYQSITGSMRARSAAERMLQDVQWAQSQAIAHNTDYILNASAACDWEISTLSNQMLRCMSPADFAASYPQVTMSVVSGAVPVTINSLGAPNPAGTYALAFTPANGARVWTLTISPTGAGSIS